MPFNELVAKCSQTHIYCFYYFYYFWGVGGRWTAVIPSNTTFGRRRGGGHEHYVKELKITSTHFYSTSTPPFNHMVVKYSQTHITSTNSTTSTTFGGSGGGGQTLAYINYDTVPY